MYRRDKEEIKLHCFYRLVLVFNLKLNYHSHGIASNSQCFLFINKRNERHKKNSSKKIDGTKKQKLTKIKTIDTLAN